MNRIIWTALATVSQNMFRSKSSDYGGVAKLTFMKSDVNITPRLLFYHKMVVLRITLATPLGWPRSDILQFEMKYSNQIHCNY